MVLIHNIVSISRCLCLFNNNEYEIFTEQYGLVYTTYDSHFIANS